MHPIWIQKIEEKRKSAVTTFWVSMVLVVLVPLLLILKGDAFLILAMFCFTGAALRIYWKDNKEIVDFAQGAKLEADALTKYRLDTGVWKEGPQRTDLQAEETPPHPEMVDENGAMLEAEHLDFSRARSDEFFTVEMENGEPLAEEKKGKSKNRKKYASADDMQLEDPASHPHPFSSPAARMQASRSVTEKH